MQTRVLTKNKYYINNGFKKSAEAGAWLHAYKRRDEHQNTEKKLHQS